MSMYNNSGQTRSVVPAFRMNALLRSTLLLMALALGGCAALSEDYAQRIPQLLEGAHSQMTPLTRHKHVLREPETFTMEGWVKAMNKLRLYSDHEPSGVKLSQPSAMTRKIDAFSDRLPTDTEVNRRISNQLWRLPLSEPIDLRLEEEEEEEPNRLPSDVATESRIINGSLATRGQLPWQARIYMDFFFACGGSLISPYYILTAGHCVNDFKMFVVILGMQDKSAAETGRSYVITTNKNLHSKYDDINLFNDIALLRLRTPATISEFIRPIRLPSIKMIRNTFVGVDTIVSGWGDTSNEGAETDKLMYVTLPVVSNAKCAESYGVDSIIGSNICSNNVTLQSPCSGDSGGPMAYKEDDGVFTLIGVTSFVPDGGCSSGPAGFTRVTSFLGWITINTGLSLRV